MKRFVRWCALALVLPAAAWSQPQKNAAAEKTVADLEQQWLKSQRTNDTRSARATSGRRLHSHVV